MTNCVIKVEGLAKQYRLGEINTGTMVHDINRWWYRILGKEDPYLKIGEENDRTSKGNSEYVWALKDIDFQVDSGDVFGIIGRNGAGKSTLLKILSRTTTPTKGRIKMLGRVASLLEVGTGFHPDLSGRDNIFLNGAILGMTKSEIKRKFEEIVDFSGVERYIDTPVKRYSSGMYVRLAFAVAAHLEPEILIVDEVLAVGDSEFQRKCLGKMKDVSEKDGRTVLFVSHNMAAVKSLCKKGLVLVNGKIQFVGSILESVNIYQKSNNTSSKFIQSEKDKRNIGNDNIQILKFEVRPIMGELLTISSGVLFEITFYNNRSNINLDVTFELKSTDEVMVFHQGKIISDSKNSKAGIYTISGELPPNLLNAGNYLFNVIFGEDQRYVLYNINDIVQFEIMNETLGNNSNILPGIIRPSIRYLEDFRETYD